MHSDSITELDSNETTNEQQKERMSMEATVRATCKLRGEMTLKRVESCYVPYHRLNSISVSA